MKLEKGDVLYAREYIGSGIRKYTISRTTEKQAICEIQNTIGNSYEIRFDRDYGDSRYVIAKGDKSGYSRTAYYISTPALNDEYIRYIREYEFSKIDVKKLSLESLCKILNIYKEAVK